MFIQTSIDTYEFNCGDETFTIAGQKFTGIVVLKLYYCSNDKYLFLENENRNPSSVYLLKIKESQYANFLLKTFADKFNKEIQDQYDIGGSKFIQCQENIKKLLE